MHMTVNKFYILDKERREKKLKSTGTLTGKAHAEES
jgi:hypothetical protein